MQRVPESILGAHLIPFLSGNFSLLRSLISLSFACRTLYKLSQPHMFRLKEIYKLKLQHKRLIIPYICMSDGDRSKHVYWFKVLLNSGEDFNAFVIQESGVTASGTGALSHYTTPLILAIKLQRIELARILLTQKNIDLHVNKADSNNWTPLHHAASKQDVESVELLLRRPGINVNKVDGDQVTPLMSAVLYSSRFPVNPAVVEAIISHPETDINVCDKEQETALHYVVKHLLLTPVMDSVEKLTTMVAVLNKLLACMDISISVKKHNDSGMTPRDLLELALNSESWQMPGVHSRFSFQLAEMFNLNLNESTF